MKKFLLLLPALALMSCEKEIGNNGNQEIKEASLIVSITPEDQTKAIGDRHGNQDKDNHVETLDFLIFRDEGEQVLEDMKHFTKEELPADLKNIEIQTTGGNKKIFAIANSHLRDWGKISKFSDITTKVASLKNEAPMNFIMTGNKSVTISGTTNIVISLSRMVSRVVVNSIATDFSNTPLEGKVLQDVKIYLINIKGSKLIYNNSDTAVKGFLNRAKYKAEDWNGAADPSMFYESIGSPISTQPHTAPHYFYCFENIVEGHTVDHPATKLVIEAKIDGKVYYYPIDINQEGFKHSSSVDHIGIKRNYSYAYNITIKRLGSSDPDQPLQYGDIVVGLTVEDWIAVPEADIIF